MNAGQFVSRLTRKSRSNFFYAFLCLPRAQREAIYACYAFCRIVDDAVDLGQDRDGPARRARPLARRDRAGLRGTAPQHPPASGCRWPCAGSRSRARALEEIIAGVEMDLDHPTYETWDALTRTATGWPPRSGSAASRSSATRIPRARDYAVNLGIALQLTNILRDVQADARARPHLPAAGRPPPLRGHRGGPGRGPLHPGVRPAHGLRGRRAPASTTSARGPRCPPRTRAASSPPRSWDAPTSRCLRAIEARRFDVFGRPRHGAAARRVAHRARGPGSARASRAHEGRRLRARA